MSNSSRSSSGRWTPLAVFAVLAGFSAASLSLATSAVAANSQSRANSSNPSPLVYTRLRYDKHFLYMMRNLQREFPYMEQPLSALTQFETQPTTYYLNEKVDASEVSENRLVFEAIDQLYKFRLFQSFQQDYDRQEDRERAFDPAKVSADRCARELDYLMLKLRYITRARAQRSPVRGVNPELLSFFDSFGTEELGSLMGNQLWLGGWKNCANRHVFDLLESPPPPPPPSSNTDAANLTSRAVSFRGRYCLASIRTPEWDELVDARAKELQKDYFKQPGQQAEYRHFFRIQVGICLPESCESSIVDRRLDDIRELATHKLREPFGSYEVSGLYCLPDESSPLRQLDLSAWLWVVVVGGWVALVLVATLVHHLLGKRDRRSVVDKVVASLSAVESYRELVRTARSSRAKKAVGGGSGATTGAQVASPSPPGGGRLGAQVSPEADIPGGAKTTTREGGAAELDAAQTNIKTQTTTTTTTTTDQPPARQVRPGAQDILFIDAIKVMFMPMIILAHVGMMTFVMSKDPIDADLVNPIWLSIIAGYTFNVDWYFTATGFITTYVLFANRRVMQTNPLFWLYTVFHRYWRLMPSYLLIFWFSRSVVQFTSYGPLWDFGTSVSGARAVCKRESWIYPLTLTANFHGIYDECIIPTWYISNDMQFYLMSLPLIVLLARCPRAGWIAGCSGISACVALRFHRYLSDPRARPIDLLRGRFDIVMRNNWDMHETYVLPQYRVAPYLVGVLAGHLAFMVNSGQWSLAGRRQDSRHYTQVTTETTTTTTTTAKLGRELRRWLSDLLRATPLALTVVVATLSSLFMVLTTTLMDLAYPRSLEPYARQVVAVIYSADHTFAAVLAALVFVPLAIGECQWARKLLDLPFWTYLSRINYFVFLAQVELIVWCQTVGDFVPTASLSDAFKLLSHCLVLLYLFAFITTILITGPLSRLEHAFIGSIFSARMRQPRAATTTGGGPAATAATSVDKSNNSNNNNNNNNNRRPNVSVESSKKPEEEVPLSILVEE